MPIIKLDNRTIEQIAAGEVIESPVSVVKELVENSIDAGAKNIVVEIKKGGKSYIRVTDDGIGIPNDQIQLAFEKHATSKIKDFSDLYDIYSLGFRGEALASISTVSNISAISKSKDDKVGKKLKISNGKINESLIATNTGTSIEVMDLFINLPARKKFLKSDIAETNAISRLMYSLALGYPNLSIKYIKDDRVEFKTNANDSLDIKIPRLLDESLNDNLIKIDEKNNLYKLEGYISTSNYYRGSRSMQYIYVNNRLIDSDSIRKTIEKIYRPLIPQARFPAFFIFIDTNPKNLDVNVHPNKRIIKFSYEEEMLTLIETTVKEALNKKNNPNKISIKEKPANAIPDLSNYQGLLDNYSGFNIVKEDRDNYEDNSFFDTKNKINIKDAKEDKVKEEKLQDNSFIDESIEYTKDKSFLYLTSLFGKYSLFKTSDEKVYLMNHRRADESIKFNKFVNDLNNSNPDSQILLKPLIIKLRAEEKNSFDKKKDFIVKLGFDIEEFGENQLIIRAVPQIFDQSISESLVKDLIDIDMTTRDEVFYKNLNRLVKKNAFRKGHVINKESALKLINELFKLDNPFKTYDGKTVILEIDEETLEKYFER